ncbi:MAG TPA: phage terminase large subunit [Blastocatellia bacterium]|jgi:phage terminase large subunit
MSSLPNEQTYSTNFQAWWLQRLRDRLSRDIEDQQAQVIDRPLFKTYRPHGAAAELHRRTDKEILISGPAGTGKSRADLEKLDDVLTQYPGARGLIVRKTLTSLKSSGLVTFDEKVRPQDRGVTFKGESAKRPAQYTYPNESVAVIGGLDKADKVLSSEYDIIVVIQAEELTVDDWEKLLTRLRNHVVPFQQLIADANPDAETHWLKQRCNAGGCVLLESRHEDNPELYDRERKEWTPRGKEYIETLDKLTGVRKLRLRYGKWAAAEGGVYEDVYDPLIHLVDDDKLRDWGIIENEIGDPIRLNSSVVRRVLAGIDWGFTNPGVLQVWPQDGDGRIYRVFEIYQTGKTIDWWIEKATEARDYFGVEVFICDPSEPAYIEQFKQAGLNAVGGFNDIAPGIQAVRQRYQLAGDGRARIYLRRDALLARDPKLEDKKKPCCTEEEIDGYVWDKTKLGEKEEPVKVNNHGNDAKRYVVAHLDIEGAVQAAGGGSDPEGETSRDRIRARGGMLRDRFGAGMKRGR